MESLLSRVRLAAVPRIAAPSVQRLVPGAVRSMFHTAFDMIAAGRTDVGRTRSRNEDSVYLSVEAGLALVCDGMGGHAAGEVASQLVIAALAHLDDDEPGGDLLSKLNEAVHQGNSAIAAHVEAEPELETPSNQMPAAPDTKAEAVPAQHIILPGETLWKIAEEMLGDGQRFQEILDANPRLKRNPNRLVPGQTIDLPSE